MRELVIKDIVDCIEEYYGYSSSRWNYVRTRCYFLSTGLETPPKSYNLSDVDFNSYSDEQLIEIYHLVIRKFYAQM